MWLCAFSARHTVCRRVSMLLAAAIATAAMAIVATVCPIPQSSKVRFDNKMCGEDR